MAPPQETGCSALHVEKLLPALEQCAGALLRAACRPMHAAPAFDLTAVATAALGSCATFVLAIVTKRKSET